MIAIGLFQIKREFAEIIAAVRDLKARIRHATDESIIFSNAISPSAFDVKPADRQRALRGCIVLAVSIDERRHDQHAALKTLRITHGRHRHVDGRAS